MGNRFAIEVWGKWDDQWQTRTAWVGQSLLAALWAFWRLRNEGTGCVKLAYRRALRDE